MKPTELYARLYHRFQREFPTVWADDHALATWVRLLVLADASWPTRPPLPRSVRSAMVRVLTTHGLLILDGDNYTILGLDAERTRRSNAGRAGAAVRWENERTSDGNAIAHASVMPSRAEQSRADNPQPPQSGGHGATPRARGTNPRAVAQLQAEKARREAQTAQRLRVAHNNGAHADEADPRCSYCIERQAAS